MYHVDIIVVVIFQEALGDKEGQEGVYLLMYIIADYTWAAATDVCHY